jgi:uncharacterized protein (DUF58 family)
MTAGWIIFVTFVVVVLQGWIYQRRGLKGIRYDRFFNVKGVFEGDEVEMVERIANRKLLPVPWLRVESKINENLEFEKQKNLSIKHQQFHKSIFSLMPYMQITRRHRVHCKKRGCYELKSVALTCGDSFGFNNESKVYEVSAQLLVYPTLIEPDSIPMSSHSWQGDVTVRRWIVEDPFMVSGVREYVYGDPLNHINWKATARVGKLQVHNRDHTADPRLMIYLNIDLSEGMWEAVTEPEVIELGISYAASITRHAISQGIQTGFGCNGHLIDEPGQPVRIPARCSNEHLMGLYEILAKLMIERSVTFFTFLEDDVKQGVTGTDYLLITSYVSERMANQIQKLKSYGNSVDLLWLYPRSKDDEGAVKYA